MKLTDEAVEAAAKRAWLDSALGRRTCDAWEALTETEQTLRRDDARRILESAAPQIRAQALKDAANAFGECEPEGSYSSTPTQVIDWLKDYAEGQ